MAISIRATWLYSVKLNTYRKAICLKYIRVLQQLQFIFRAFTIQVRDI